MKKINILRFGGLGVASHRYIDVLDQENIQSICFIVDKNMKHEIEELINGIRYFKKQYLLKKISVIDYKTTLFNKLIRKVLISFYKWYLPVAFSNLLNINLKRKLNDIDLKSYNIVWIGDNDFDGSNYVYFSISKILKKNGLKVIRSYKETRSRYLFLEKYMLNEIDVFVFPYKAYKDFFEKIYGSNILEGKCIEYSDLDQRSRFHYEGLQNKNHVKYSDIDGKIHIAIVTGRAACYPCERSGNRYVLFKKIEELLLQGYCVHLFVKTIIHSVSDGREMSDSTYHQLAKKNTNFHLSFEKLSLGSPIYDELLKCDYGFLHHIVTNDNGSLFEFQKINVGNRFFEYQCAGLPPVIEKSDSETTVQEELAKKHNGIVYKNIDELNKKTASNRKKELIYINSFPKALVGAMLNCDKKSI